MKKTFVISLVLSAFFVFVSCKKSDGNIDNVSTQNESLKQNTTSQDSIIDTVKSQKFFNALRKAHKLYTGDFDKMMKRRLIRVLVPYSRTLFFNDKGQERGISAENFREFEAYINKKYHKELNDIPITVAFVPTSRDKLISNLLLGVGDIAAGNLTITNERLKKIDFASQKDELSVSEIPLNNKRALPLVNKEELSGKTIYVRRSSSYFESIQLLNKLLLAKRKPLVKIKIVSEDLEDEDLMEMLNAGIISTIVVDDWKAKMWSPILPNIRLNDSAAVRENAQIGCAFRKNSPLLSAELNDFYYQHQKHLGVVPYRFKKYNQIVRDLYNPTKSDNARRYNDIINLFKKYGKKYDFDPLMLAAMGFQESRLNQNLRSPVGAVGVMQLMPRTGKSMKVGNITVTEGNIHAGTKYISTIMNQYFSDTDFNEFNKALFAFASYNAGPNRIASLRSITIERGFNPDIWLGNTEVIASEKIGKETTTYVRNIVKYYYSYKLMIERNKKQELDKEKSKSNLKN